MLSEQLFQRSAHPGAREAWYHPERSGLFDLWRLLATESSGRSDKSRRRGGVDVAIVWGPLAGYFASRMQTDLTIVPVSPQFALTPDGHWLYASNDNAGLATATDLRTDEVAATLVVGIEPEGVAVSPDGRWVYVTAETSSTISVIDTRSNTVVANCLVGARPRAAVFSPDGTRAYVTAEIDGTVSVVDVAARPSCHRRLHHRQARVGHHVQRKAG